MESYDVPMSRQVAQSVEKKWVSWLQKPAFVPIWNIALFFTQYLVSQ